MPIETKGGDNQQQRLCIARALAVEPEVILMDESCSALDPESTMKVEGLMEDLAQKYTILIVTHSMEQAAMSLDLLPWFLGNLVREEVSKMNIFLKVLVIGATLLYIVSPIDAAPGPIDDIIVAVLGTAATKKLSSGKYFK